MRLFNTSLLVGIFIFIGCSTLQAQNNLSYNVKHYDIFDGLSNNWISDIFQDKDGFLWFGTQYGINRFDGKNFKVFTYIPGDTTAIKANWIRSITQLDDHKIYFGSLGGGINVLDPYQEKFTELFIKSNSNNHNISLINKLTPDDEKNLWISSTNGVFRYHPKDSTIKELYNRGSSNISISKNGSKLILGRQERTSKKQEQGHSIFKVVHDTIQEIPLPKDQKLINTFSISKDSTLVYTNKALYITYKSNGAWSQQKLNFESTYKTAVRDVPFIFKDKEGWIWVNGGKKIYRFSSDFTQQEAITIEALLNYPSSVSIRANCMFQDNESNYWLGTNLGVFQLIHHKPFRHPFLGELGKVREIVGRGDKIWFALPDGIYTWNKTKINSLKKINKKPVTSMVCASDSFLYTMGRDNQGQLALLKIDSNSNKETPIYFPNLDFSLGVCWRVIEDHNQRLWIAQWDNMIVYDLKDQSYFKIRFPRKRIGIIELYMDSFDNIWVGSINEGLLKFSNASKISEDENHNYKQFLHDVFNPNSISSNLIQSIRQDDNGLLWIGTDGGLNCLDIETEKFERYVRNDKMPNDKILTIINDTKGKLWLSTISHGILSFDIQTKKFDHFMTTDGLYDNSMLLSSAYLDDEDFIWLGSEGGIQYFNPDNLTTSKTRTPNMIWESYTKFKADTTIVYKFPNKSLSNENVITISPQDQSINFLFQTLTFEKPEKVRYHFKLQGYHKDWLPMKEKGSLTLSYLPKGSYELLVKATSEDQWEIPYEPIAITVVPPWYKTNLANALYILFIGSLIFVLYRIQLRIKIAETEKEFIIDLSQTKTRWFNQIAHEFRTPLTVILGAVDQAREKHASEIGSKTDKHLFQIEEQANHLSNQVHQILEIAKMQDNQLEVRTNNSDFVAFQRYLFHSFTSLAEKKDITLSFSSSHNSLYLLFDEDKWRKISTNIISNAIKYNTSGGKVFFSIVFKENKAALTIQIKDTGIGMSNKFVSKLFDPFAKEKIDDSQGVGLGLTLTKELVQLMKGEIAVHSQKGVGTTFTIKIPAIIPDDKPAAEIKNEEIILFEENDTPVVLIAEDHKEVRDYIHFCLASNFTILQAENGLVAWELCEKHLPDLVISDIMMPKWNGIQLSSQIRQNIATNHIPIILLTAKSGQSNQLEGLKTGADAYLTKPFNRTELLIRVDNLIKTRQKLREKYQRGETIITSKNKTIDHFMKNVIQIIHKQLDNDEFAVPQLAEYLSISRVHLFRKIKNLTGLPPTKFIRKIRLQKAQELLLQSELSISEIAYQTGFKDPAYFTRVYVEEFGKPPSEFRKQS
ncbi:hybrid sensor histidine kinase/response regulator transcription factor [Flavivirga algicola]|uniref:histidine kinase n=1 Tax=Flavivirga algicola TaxID=2729136 RepID=A0ABX1RZV9_9FLAO|nr:hybrid sensor histidine kinase/response regulator transcription factor [Flavivirga algicola]NMH89146.1 response regulator [Flavivirga algicola]